MISLFFQKAHGELEKIEKFKMKKYQSFSFHNETETKRDLLMKKLRKKYEELENERKIKQEEEIREILRRKKQKKFSNFMKNLTSSIILTIAEGLFQSIISLGACICYVITTYQDSGIRYNFIKKL